MQSALDNGLGYSAGVDEALLVTRGDCMHQDDPPIGKSELLGKVTEVQRAGSIFSPAPTLSPFRWLLARLFCHWALFRRIGLRLWNYRQTGVPFEDAFVSAAR